MAVLPGQRAAQRPLRAAIAAQRRLGRATATGGGMAGRMVLDVDGRRWTVEIGPGGRQVWTEQRTGTPYTGGPDNEEAG
jgi:hypothetical protein